jgi:hypothetical protein
VLELFVKAVGTYLTVTGYALHIFAVPFVANRKVQRIGTATPVRKVHAEAHAGDAEGVLYKSTLDAGE